MKSSVTNIQIGFLIISSLILLNSCATHLGNLTSNAVIVDKNFRLVGLAVGESQATKVLGFGGLKKDALVYEAKKDLYEKINLKSGQALTNITVDFKQEFYFVYSKVKVTITGEVIDFNPDSTNNLVNNYTISQRKGYEVGEMIYVMKNASYIKCEIKSLDINTLQVEINNEKLKTDFPILVRYEEVFKLRGSFMYNDKPYSVGDNIQLNSKGIANPSGNSTTDTFSGIIVGLNDKDALILDENGKLFRQIRIRGVLKKNGGNSGNKTVLH